ncbi:MAG: hypothetical protein ACTIM3_06710, partial [Leuconostoc falkenbergense]
QKQGKEFTHTLYNFSEGETARDGNKFHYSSDPLMAGGEPDLTALSMDSQTDQLKVQNIKFYRSSVPFECELRFTRFFVFL